MERSRRPSRRILDRSLTAALGMEHWVESRLGDARGAGLARRRIALSRWLQRSSGRLEGMAYRVAGRRPDPDVDDVILRARVASTIGSVVRSLDLPRVRVHVLDGNVRLEGRVDTDESARTIQRAAMAVPGVRDVFAVLVRGLGPSDHRPSEEAQHHSRAHHELLGAVRALDIGDLEEDEQVVGAVLRTFLDLLPDDTRRHLLSHLPADVQSLQDRSVVVGTPERARTVDAFISDVASAATQTPGTAALAIRTVLATLRDLVPEEVGDVEAVLPTELAALWADPLRVDLTEPATTTTTS